LQFSPFGRKCHSEIRPSFGRSCASIREVEMNQRLSRRFLLSILAAGIVLPIAAAVAVASPTAPAPAGATVEVHPSIQVSVEAVSLQKNAQGGIARLRLHMDADARVRDIVVTLRTPDGVVFADGSTLKTWNLEAGAQGRRTVPVEVIAPADGVHLLSAEMTGMLGDNPVHRGASYRLAIGVTEAKPKVRGGAIEFAAVPGEGGGR
jgi:hypothetical protein